MTLCTTLKAQRHRVSYQMLIASCYRLDARLDIWTSGRRWADSFGKQIKTDWHLEDNWKQLPMIWLDSRESDYSRNQSIAHRRADQNGICWMRQDGTEPVSSLKSSSHLSQMNSNHLESNSRVQGNWVVMCQNLFKSFLRENPPEMPWRKVRWVKSFRSSQR